jgi:amidase
VAGTTEDELRWTDGVALAALVRAGEVSVPEVVEQAIARIEALDGALGAVVFRRYDRARAEAGAVDLEAPLAGVPFLLKDAVQHSEGDRYQHGMGYLRDHPWVSPHDSELTRRYRAAGLIQLGRTKVPELTTSPSTEPLAFGPAHNPWDLTRSTGGSSGGSGAAVAAGLVPIAHGNDMGGSIRIPASCCGLVGLKPSRDRTSLAPDFGEYWGPLTHEHVLTRSVRDSAVVLDATAGSVPGDFHQAPLPIHPWANDVGRDPGSLRIGLVTEPPNGSPVTEECLSAAGDAARLLESLGHHVEAADGRIMASETGPLAMATVIAAGVARDILEWEERLGIPVDQLEPMSEAMLEGGRSITAIQLINATNELARWSRQIAVATAPFDLVLTPTLAIVPPKLGILSGDVPIADQMATLGAMTAFVLPFDISGQPAVSLPLWATAEGLPVGIQLVAAYGREDLLFQVASQLEVARPWAGRRPKP